MSDNSYLMCAQCGVVPRSLSCHLCRSAHLLPLVPASPRTSADKHGVQKLQQLGAGWPFFHGLHGLASPRRRTVPNRLSPCGLHDRLTAREVYRDERAARRGRVTLGHDRVVGRVG